MSILIKIKKEEIFLSEDKEVLNIYLGSDDFGNLYAEIDIKYVLNILEENKIIEND